MISLPQLKQVDQLCDGYLISKQRCSPFPQEAVYRAERPLQLVHGDICGPITPATLAGKRYFVLIVDDFTRYMWVALLKSKDDALCTFKKKIKATAEMETDLKIKALRIDRGGKFTSNEFSEFCENLEVTWFLTALYSPQSNGVVSRRNQTGVVMARSLLNNSQVPSMYLGEAITIVVYILNRAPGEVYQV